MKDDHSPSDEERNASEDSRSAQLTCAITVTTSETETTQLVAYVNGSRVGAIGDQIVRTFVGGYLPVLVVGSFGPRVHAAFNAMTVRSIMPPPVSTP